MRIDLMEQVVRDLKDTHKTFMDLERSDFSKEELSYLNSKLFCCDGCGRWCKVDELCGDAGYDFCEECFESFYED